MANVFLINKTRQTKTYNIGDKSIAVSHPVETRMPDGKTGVKISHRMVSDSVIIHAGKRVLVSSIILKQRAVQRDRDKGDLMVVKQEAEAVTPEKAATPPPPKEKPTPSSDGPTSTPAETSSPKRTRKIKRNSE